MKYEIAVTGAKEAAINLRQMEAAMAGVNKEAAKMGQMRPGNLTGAQQKFFDALSPAAQQRLLAGNPAWQSPQSVIRPPAGAGIGNVGTIRTPSGILPSLNQNNWKLGAMGVGASMFSPWIGARMLNQAFPGVGNKLGGGRGGSGIFGAGGMAGFGEWFIALSVASRALKLAFEELMSAVKQGAELYQRSARLGMNTGTVSAMQETFKLLGMSPQMTEKLLAYGQFGHGSRMKPGEFQDAVVGASRGVMGREEMQAIRNLTIHGELAEAYRRVSGAAEILSKNSDIAMKLNMDLGVLAADWRAMWSEMMRFAQPTIHAVVDGADMLIKSFTVLLQVMNALSFASLWEAEKRAFAARNNGAAAVLKAFFTRPTPGADFQKFGGGSVGSRPKTSWESMGLIVNGGIAGTDYARQTASNTRKIAELISNILPDGRKKAGPNGFLNSVPNAYNMP